MHVQFLSYYADFYMLLNYLHHFLLPVLFLTGLTAGTVDAIAGGGGLISLPVLLGLGIPPHLALGTNKLQSSFGTSVATFSFYKKGYFSLKNSYQGLLFGLLGAASGAYISQLISGSILNKIIPILLFMILIYVLLAPKKWEEDHHPKMNELLFFSITGFALGFYDGFFGPGTGSFWVFGLTFFMGYNLIKATAYTKLFNLNSNLVALACFAIGHNVDYRIGCVMAAGQLIGGRLGAKLAIKNGAEFIRPIFVMVVTATIFTLIYKNFVGLHHYIAQMILGFAILMTATIIFFWSTRKGKTVSAEK